MHGQQNIKKLGSLAKDATAWELRSSGSLRSQ